MKILIVDDMEQNRYLLRALLEGSGCAVADARHGAEALAKARQSPPQMVISDLLMPVMDGYTLLRHWKADDRLKAIPFVVYTATYTEPRDERLALDLGADAFILKPTEPETFMARIHEVLAKTKGGELSPSQAHKGKEEALLKEYSEVLIRKLEEKTLLLTETNRLLQQEIIEHKRAEKTASRLAARPVTTTWPLTPLSEVLNVSLTVMVWPPAVRSKAPKKPVPLVKVVSAGKAAWGSVLEKWTVPV